MGVDRLDGGVRAACSSCLPPLPQATSAGVTLTVCSPCLAERVADAGSRPLPAGPVAHIFLLAESVPLHLLKEARALLLCPLWS